jgi:hypothetical protein
MKYPLNVFALLSLSAVACGGDSSDTDDIATSSDAIEGTSDTQALVATVLDPVAAAPTPEAAATMAAAAASTYYQPAGCVVATTAGATATYQFTNCRGPYGLVNLNGSLTARYVSRSATGWTVQVTGSLQANSTTLRPDATATVSAVGASRTATVTVAGGGTGRRGVSYSNRGTYTATWDGTCFGISGSVTSTASTGAAATFTATGYRRCRGQCPDAGGVLSVSGEGGAVTITYSGGATATVTGARTSTVRLFCAGSA